MATPLQYRSILATWWPLAGSWLLMSVEIPAMASVVSRLPNAEINLAAFGGIVFPIALLVESPIIMLLTASTALSTDEASYWRLRRFVRQLAIGVTLVHALIAFTPLFKIISLDIIKAPAETLEPARLGFAILLFWSAAIADRRFHQGLLIRFGHQNQVAIGTLVRLFGTAIPLVIGISVKSISGIVVATTALAVGVTVEAVYIRWCTRAVRNGPLRDAPPADPPLDGRRIRSLYFPLALSQLFALLSMPIGAAAISRMPMAMASLAIWPALNGVSFMLRSGGVAFNEVVVRHAGDPGGERKLVRFALAAGVLLALLTLVVTLTPLAEVVFRRVMGLDPELAQLASAGLIWASALPIFSFLRSHYQGLLVHVHRTSGVSEAVGLFLVVMTAVLYVGVKWPTLPGAAWVFVALTAGAIAQTGWLAWRWSQASRDLPAR